MDNCTNYQSVKYLMLTRTKLDIYDNTVQKCMIYLFTDAQKEDIND